MSIPYSFRPMGGSSAPYRKLQYLESNSAAWIDTGIIASNTQFPVLNFKFNITENNNARPILGQTWGYGYILFHTNGSQNMFSVYYGYNNISMPVYTPGDVTVEDYCATGFKINGTSYSFRNTPSFAESNSIYLFAVRKRLYATGDLIKIYYCQIVIDNTVMADFIPVLWNANTPYTDGNTGSSVTPAAAKPGMYDLVSKKLFVNQGSDADFSYA